MSRLLFHVPSRIHFGFDSLLSLGGEAAKIGSRAFLVVDSVFSGNELLEQIRDLLKKRRIDLFVFDEAGSGSSAREIVKGAELAGAGKAQMVIGIGGVKTLSMARCIAHTVGGPSIYDLLDGLPQEAPALPFIQILTTCRHHFMLTDRTLVIDARTGTPRILTLPDSYPEAIIMDPVLTLGLSAKYAVATLMETFLVAVEGYLSRKSTFISDSMFLKAVATSLGVLRELSRNPEDRSFRESASQAGLLAALGVSMSSLGAGSSLALALSGKFSVPKSFVASILLPYILEYGRAARPEKIARLAPILGEYTEGLSVVDAASQVIDSVRHRIGIEGMPTRLQELGISEGDFPAIIDIVAEMEMNQYLPVPLAREDYLDILITAL